MVNSQDRDRQSALELSEREMRELGYAVIDAIVERTLAIRDLPTARPADRATMDALLWESAPGEGVAALDVLHRALDSIMPYGHRNSHPRYFGYVPNPSNFVGAMADALASGFNTFSGMWMASPGAAETEALVVDWLRGWCRLPDSGGGLLLSGSSMANLTALVAARHAQFGADGDLARSGTIYYSDQAHSSVAKGARTIGIAPDRHRKVHSDTNFRMSLDHLRQAIEEDRANGLRPFCVIAAAGTTNTAAVDPLTEIADLCRRHGVWMHVDGAFAASTMLTERGQLALAGIERADSIALDAHKWFFQPIECGALLVRDVQTLKAAFHVRPEYLLDAESAVSEVQFCDLGPQLTRNFRALKLWMSIQTFGVDAFAAAIDRGIDLAELAEQELRLTGTWDIVTPASLSVLSFGVIEDNDQEASRRNAAIAERTLMDGYLMLSTTVLRGRTVLRMCVINPRATEDEIRESVRRLTQIATGD